MQSEAMRLRGYDAYKVWSDLRTALPFLANRENRFLARQQRWVSAPRNEHVTKFAAALGYTQRQIHSRLLLEQRPVVDARRARGA